MQPLISPRLQPIDTLLRYTLILLMTLIVLDVSWQVITRFVLPTPSSYTEELARFLLIWISLLGAAYAYAHRLHLGIELLAARLSGRGKHWLAIIGYGLSGLFALLALVIGGSQLTLLTLELKQVSGALGLPMAYVYCVLPISGGLMVLFSLDFIGQELNKLKHTH